MAKIGVSWLEPERDVGKTTYIAIRDLVCDRSEDLPAGSVVLAKWKSSGRSYRARLLSNLLAKSKRQPKNRGSKTLPTSGAEPANCEEEDVMDVEDAQLPLSDSDSEDDLPLITRKDVDLPVYSDRGCSESCKEALEHLERTVSALKDEVKELKAEICEVKQRQLSGNEQTSALNAGQAEIMTKLDFLMENMIKVNRTSEETFSVINSRIAVKAAQRANASNVATTSPGPTGKDQKRKQPALGNVEGDCIIAYADGKKVLSVKKSIYIDFFEDSQTPSSFLRKLLRHSFSNEELASSNFNGGEVTSLNGLVEKKCLDRQVVLALFAQVELEFPNSTQGKCAFGKLRDAVNTECRNAARKLRQLAI